MVKRLYKFPEILFFQEGPGVRNHQYTTSGVKLLNVSNLRNGKIDLTTSDRYISENEAFNKYSHFLCDPNDFIIASSGIKIDSFDSKMGFIHQSDLPVCMNTSTIRFKVLNKEVLEIRYFMYYLKSIVFKKVLTKVVTGSAQLNFGPSHLKNMSISLPNFDIQKTIVQRLDRVNNLIEIKRKLLFLLDELVKSRFVEMFGDLNHNPLYPVVNLKSLIMGSPSNGFFASKELYDKNGKVNLVGVKEVVGNLYINIYDTPKLNVDESILEKYLIDYGDMLFCRSSLVKSGIAKASIVPKSNNKSCIFECHTIKIKFNQQLCIPEFMQVQTEQTYFRNQVIQNSKTATMTTISQQGIVDTKVLLPPLSIQQKFTKFLSQINKLKSDVQKSIDETQLLMDSLMQEYFG